MITLDAIHFDFDVDGNPTGDLNAYHDRIPAMTVIQSGSQTFAVRGRSASFRQNLSFLRAKPNTLKDKAIAAARVKNNGGSIYVMFHPKDVPHQVTS